MPQQAATFRCEIALRVLSSLLVATTLCTAQVAMADDIADDVVPVTARAESPNANMMEGVRIIKRISDPSRYRPQEHVQDLLKQWREPRMTLAQKNNIASLFLNMGDIGARALAKEVTGDFKKVENDYISDFQKAATRALKAKWGDQVEVEIASLRETVISTARAPQLTKQMIHDISDPAMDRLEELLSIQREQVLVFDKELAGNRDQLVSMLKLWPRIVSHIEEKNRAEFTALPSHDAFNTELKNKETLMAMMALPMPDKDRQVMIDNHKFAKAAIAAGTMSEGEARGIEILNVIRLRAGLNADKIDAKLCDAGRDHCSDMIEYRFFAHESPVTGKTTPWDRAKLAETTANGENIFMGSGRAEDAIRAWWYSPGHHRNMMGTHKRHGLGNEGNHWTQMFGG